MNLVKNLLRFLIAILIISSISLTSAKSESNKSSGHKKKIENSKKSTKKIKKRAVKKAKNGHLKNNHKVTKKPSTANNQEITKESDTLDNQPTDTLPNLKTAVIASGCFFGIEEIARKEVGVLKAEAGYAGGTVPNPSYDSVNSGKTGHAMAVKITYDANQTSFEELARMLLKIHNPISASIKPEETLSPIRSEIFYDNEAQKEVAENLIKTAKKSRYFNGKITVNLSKLNAFYKAENYYRLYSENKEIDKICQIVNKKLKF